MPKYAVTCNQECRDELRKIGTITYECNLMDDFLFLNSEKTIEEIMKIDGVSHVREQYIGKYATKGEIGRESSVSEEYFHKHLMVLSTLEE